MTDKIIKCRKSIRCIRCDEYIKYGQECEKIKYKIDDEIGYLYVCLDCVDEIEKASIECKNGNHEYENHFYVEYEGFVPYPNFTGKLECRHCGLIREGE